MSEATSQTESQLEQGFQNLKVDMNRLRSDLADVAQALVEAGRAEAGEAKTRLQTLAQQRLEDARRVLESARQRGQSATEKIKHQVEQKPLASVLIALGAGLMVGMLMKRK